MAKRTPRALEDVDQDIAEAKDRLDRLVREQKEAREFRNQLVAHTIGEAIVPKLERGLAPEAVLKWLGETLATTKRGQGAKAARSFLDGLLDSPREDPRGDDRRPAAQETPGNQTGLLDDQETSIGATREAS